VRRRLEIQSLSRSTVELVACQYIVWTSHEDMASV
jgi:hypothetical protein